MEEYIHYDEFSKNQLEDGSSNSPKGLYSDRFIGNSRGKMLKKLTKKESEVRFYVSYDGSYAQASEIASVVNEFEGKVKQTDKFIIADIPANQQAEFKQWLSSQGYDYEIEKGVSVKDSAKHLEDGSSFCSCEDCECGTDENCEENSCLCCGERKTAMKEAEMQYLIEYDGSEEQRNELLALAKKYHAVYVKTTDKLVIVFVPISRVAGFQVELNHLGYAYSSTQLGKGRVKHNSPKGLYSPRFIGIGRGKMVKKVTKKEEEEEDEEEEEEETSKVTEQSEEPEDEKVYEAEEEEDEEIEEAPEKAIENIYSKIEDLQDAVQELALSVGAIASTQRGLAESMKTLREYVQKFDVGYRSAAAEGPASSGSPINAVKPTGEGFKTDSPALTSDQPVVKPENLHEPDESQTVKAVRKAQTPEPPQSVQQLSGNKSNDLISKILKGEFQPADVLKALKRGEIS